MGQLVRFCVPFLLSNFLQAMYNVTDTLVVSWFAGPNTVSGVATGGQITLIAMNFAIGFTVGGTVLIGQFFGAGKRAELKATIGTMFTSLACLSLLITALVVTFARPLLRLVNTPDEAFGEAYIYLVICMGGTVFTFGYNAVAAILRGMGDSKNPLYFVLIAGVVNTLLDLPFVGLFGWGAAGDAASTVIAQALSLTLAVIYLRKRDFVFDFRRENFRIHTERLRQIIKIGLPNSLQHVVVGMSFLIMMTLANRFGVDASAATGIVGKFNGLAILPAIAMSSSVSSMAAQNIGAGKHTRAAAAMRSGILLSLPIGALFFSLAFFAPQVVMGLFTNEPLVIEHGVSYIRLFCIDYVVVPFMFCLNGLLMGAGLTVFTMFSGMLASVLLRVPLALIFSEVLDMGLPGIGLAAPLATAGSLAAAFFFYKTGRWKEKRLIGSAPLFDDA
jgi:putative MATE family efflux protein